MEDVYLNSFLDKGILKKSRRLLIFFCLCIYSPNYFLKTIYVSKGNRLFLDVCLSWPQEVRRPLNDKYWRQGQVSLEGRLGGFETNLLLKILRNETRSSFSGLSASASWKIQKLQNTSGQLVSDCPEQVRSFLILS